jgi:hypothetical protein
MRRHIKYKFYFLENFKTLNIFYSTDYVLFKNYFGKLFTFNNLFIINILSSHLFQVKLQIIKKTRNTNT